ALHDEARVLELELQDVADGWLVVHDEDARRRVDAAHPGRVHDIQADRLPCGSTQTRRVRAVRHCIRYRQDRAGIEGAWSSADPEPRRRAKVRKSPQDLAR